MCGILGSINNQDIACYAHLIRHRGPDAFGAECFNINGNTIDLVHRRLSIVDLSEAGNQPMFSFDGKSCIIFNGEIYNHEYLRTKLQDIPFRGHSDTETIVNYFRKFDIQERLSDLNGIFSFAFIDFANERLYLARDRFGVKPHYYFFQDNLLLFSSEIRPIKALLHPEIDQASLVNSLRMRYVPSPSTIYHNIYKVEPGQILQFDLKENILLHKSYFVKAPKTLGSRRSSYEKLIQEYGDLFEMAVTRQLMSDVEVGILLSGGVDSALVAAIAKQKSKAPVKAFTVGFEGEHHDVDEINYACQTAEILGLEHFYKKIDFTDLFNSVKKITEIVEEPIGTTSIIPMYFLAELAASKVKVVLSGQGADEPLGGYNKYKGLRWLEYSRKLQTWMPLTKCAKFFYHGNEKLRRMISSMQNPDNLGSLIEFNAISSVEEAVDLMKPSESSDFYNLLKDKEELFKRTWKGRTPDNSSLRNLFLYYDMRTSLADDLLMYTDKVTMHFSLECRVPILDNDLIDFIESLDSRYKFDSKRGKIIHKDFARAYLPSSIVERKKLGFKSPTDSWFKENIDHIEHIFNNEAFCHWFDLSAVKKLLVDHCGGRNMEKQIFLLLSICYLLELKMTVYDR